MENKERQLFTTIGVQYDNSSAVDLIKDGQLIDDYHILNPDHVLTITDVITLQEIKDLLPYGEGDFRKVEVLPYRDHEVDYTNIIFDIASLFEGEVIKSTDGESVLMRQWHTRVMAQAGLQFGIIPGELPVIPGIQPDSQAEPVNMEDAMGLPYFSGPTGPIEHEPDLPVTLYIGGAQEKMSQNGHSTSKPPHVRMRLDPRIGRELL